MAETNGSLHQTHKQNPSLQSLFHVLDPISLILAQNSSDSSQPVPLQLTTETYIMERGPRYREYAELRERKLKMKTIRQQESEESDFKQTPPKKQVKFQSCSMAAGSRKGYSVLAQSVPDFSAVLRKENRKPVQELTPPLSKNCSKIKGILSNSRGSKSANAGEKRSGNGGGPGGLMTARKSYASMEELKGLSTAAANAINGECKGGRGGGIGLVGAGAGGRKTVLGHRQF